MPVLHVLVVVEVLAPLNQIVYFIVELVVLHVQELLIVEGVLVELFELLLEPLRVDRGWVHLVTLFVDQLCILCISV